MGVVGLEKAVGGAEVYPTAELEGAPLAIAALYSLVDIRAKAWEVVSASLWSMPPVATPAAGTLPENPGGGVGGATTTVELEDTSAIIIRKAAAELVAVVEVCTEGGALPSAASTLISAVTVAVDS